MAKPLIVILGILQHCQANLLEITGTSGARAFSRTQLKAGNKIAARSTIIATTTSNSMSVKARRRAELRGESFIMVSLNTGLWHGAGGLALQQERGQKGFVGLVFKCAIVGVNAL